MPDNIWLPCPFCGSAAIEAMWKDRRGCSDPDCGAYRANLTQHNWNRRAPPPWQSERTASISGNMLVTYPIIRDSGTTPIVFMAHKDTLGWDTGSWRLHEKPWAWMPLPEPCKEKL